LHATGRLFQELLILTKLIDKGNTIKNIILIDPIFKNIIKECSANNITVLLKEYDNFINILNITNLKEAVETRLAYNALVDFIGYIQNIHPEDINFYLYENSENYINDCVSMPELRGTCAISFDHFKTINGHQITNEQNSFNKIKQCMQQHTQAFALLKGSYDDSFSAQIKGKESNSYIEYTWIGNSQYIAENS